MIGNKKYLNCGLGGPTLEAFTKFIQKKVDFSIDTFFIDPADNNPRAKHVYEKGGFTTVATFYRDFGDEKKRKTFSHGKEYAQSAQCWGIIDEVIAAHRVKD
jgi:RimJ/RimL family protein N-acetyltransferase